MSQIRVLFVCMGNICRSPMAEGVFAALVERADLTGKIEVDSAGTSGWHEGEGANPPAIQAAEAKGYSLERCVSRPVAWQDYKKFDYILAMDELNEQTLRGDASDDLQDRIHLFMSFARQDEAVSVPDPYGGPDKDFEFALEMVEEGAAALLNHIRTAHGL
jgi:protein-tyrosine phosphatase